MGKISEWKVYCATEGGWHTWYLPAVNPAPTTCPVDTAHLIEADKTRLVQEDVTAFAEQSNGAILVAQVGRLGRSMTHATHDFGDPTTWYSQAVAVVGDPLVDSGDGLTFTSSNQNWIDVTHGKVLAERRLAASFPVVVYINGTPATPRAPFAAAGGDYVVDYAAGTVTFEVSQAGQTVTADYHRADGSAWKMIPAAGTSHDIEDAELQFTDGTTWNDTIIREILMRASDAVANGLNIQNRNGTQTPLDASDLVSNGGAVPDADLVVVDAKLFDSIQQLIDDVRGSYPEVPALSGGPRGSTAKIHGFPFWYSSVNVLQASKGMEMHICLENDQPFTGGRVTVSFYCSVHGEAL